MVIDGILQDFLQKCIRAQTGVIVLFTIQDQLDPTKAAIGISTNGPPAMANSIFRTLLGPTPETFKVLGQAMLGEKKIEECTDEEKNQLQVACVALLQQVIPTLILQGLRQEDEKLIKPASNLILV